MKLVVILVLFLSSVFAWAQNSRRPMVISPVASGDNSPSVGYMKDDSRITYNFYLEINCYVTCDIGDVFRSYKDKPNVTFNVAFSNAALSPTYPTSITTQLSGLYTGASTATGFGNTTFSAIIGRTENGSFDGTASTLQWTESYNSQPLGTTLIQPITRHSAMSDNALLSNAADNRAIGGFGSEPLGQGIGINGLVPTAQWAQSRIDEPLGSALTQPIELYATMNNGVANSQIDNGNASPWQATAEAISKWSVPICCFGNSVRTTSSIVSASSILGAILTTDALIPLGTAKFLPIADYDLSKPFFIDLTSHVFAGDPLVLNPIKEIKY
jgi:hypothetical protein